MPIEAASWPSELVPGDPAGNQPGKQGDDHIRLLKQVIKNAFPTLSRAFYPPQTSVKAVNYVVLSTDDNTTFLVDATGAARSITLPTLGATDIGWNTTVKKSDASANAVTIVGTVGGVASPSLTAQHATMFVIWTGTAWEGFYYLPVTLAGNAIIPGTLTVLGTTTLVALIASALTISGLLTLSSTSHVLGPVGTTAQRPAGQVLGRWRINGTTGLFEWDDGVAWKTPNLTYPASSAIGLAIDNGGSPNTQLTVAADEAMLVDTSGNAIKHTAVSVTIDSTTTGANGCDVGTREANKDYYIWLISDGVTIAGLLHKDNVNAPTMPGTYTYKKLVGWQRTDASSNFKRIRQRGFQAQYVPALASPTLTLPVMANGDTGFNPNVTTDPATWTAVAVATFVPSNATAIRIVLMNRYNNGSVSNVAVNPNNRAGANLSANPPATGLHTAANLVVSTEFLLESANIFWCGDGSGAGLLCQGFRFPL